MNGEREQAALYATEAGRIRMPVTLRPHESRLFVFKNTPTKQHITRVRRAGTPLFPSTDGILDDPVPDVRYGTNGELRLVSDKEGTYEWSTNEGQTFTTDLPAPTIYEVKDFRGKMTLYPSHALSAPSTDTITLDMTSLKSFTEFDQPEVRYFSGVASYQINFDLPASLTDTPGSTYLSLGPVEAAAEITLNGQSLGNVWMPDVLIPVHELRTKNNQLEITLGTTYRNRFIGDYREYGELRNLWTTASVGSYLSKESSLKPAGVMGPLRIIQYPSADEPDPQ